MTTFVYEPLDIRQPSFRLICLVRGDWQPIQCVLFHATIYDSEDAIEYEALSYTWGSIERTKPVEVNGQTLHITVSLAQALRNLRYVDQDRVLWIDAICIDQSNAAERGHQVQQMASIYENARQVILWLGEASHNTDRAMVMVQDLEQQALQYPCNQWHPADERWIRLLENPLLLLRPYDQQGYKTYEQERAGLEELLNRSWFRRIWILQEVAKARSAQVVCGAKSVSARIFAVAPRLRSLVPGPLQQAVLDIMPGPSRRFSWWSMQRDLETLLLKFRESEATDERDKVYALLGISSNACATVRLLPDYTKSVDEVMHATMKFIEEETPERNLLHAYFPEWKHQKFLSLVESLRPLECLESSESTDQDAFESAVDRGDAGQALRLLETQNLRATTEPCLRNINRADQNGRTPMLWSAALGRVDIMRMYCQRGNGIVNWQDRTGRTSLSLGVANGHEEIVKLLLAAYGILPGLADGRGRTPLSWAASRGFVAIAKLLLEDGRSDVNAVDKSGWTALALAMDSGHDEMVQLLGAYSALLERASR